MHDTPAMRPRGEAVRRTARILLIDPSGRLLMFQDSDVQQPELRFWITPGGGIDPGESPRQAALREALEETGRPIDDAELLGPVARRTVTLHFTDRVKRHHDTFFVAFTPNFEVTTDGWTQLEWDSFVGHRWWHPDELATTTETIWPGSLLDILAVVNDEQQWPVSFDDGHESTG